MNNPIKILQNHIRVLKTAMKYMSENWQNIIAQNNWTYAKIQDLIKDQQKQIDIFNDAIDLIEKKEKVWISVEEQLPNQKEFVWVKTSKDIVIPCIYYKSMSGFYHYSNFYHEDHDNIYKKARLQDKHKVKDPVAWQLLIHPEA